MDIGLAIFASVVLILAVYHPTFRKVFFWLLGIAAVGTVLFYGGLYLYSVHQENVRQAEYHQKYEATMFDVNAFIACEHRFPNLTEEDIMACSNDVNAQPVVAQ
jgi:hypothetical protein